MPSTASAPPGPEPSSPGAEAGPSNLHRTSSVLSMASTEPDDDERTEFGDDGDWNDSRSVASQSMTSVIDPLEEFNLEHTAPESSSTPRINRTLPTPGSRRKRGYAFSDDEDSMSIASSVSMSVSAKKPRLSRCPSNMSFEFSQRLRGEPTSGSPSSRLLRSFSRRDDPRPFTGPRPRLLSASSSHSDLSSLLGPPSANDMFASSALEYMRAYTRTVDARAASRASSPAPPDCSAKIHMRAGKTAIDFSIAGAPPPVAQPNTTGPDPPGVEGDPNPDINNTINTDIAPNTNQGPWTYARPVSWSSSNMLAFSRGNRVHMRSFAFGQNDETMQFCKIAKDAGDLQLLEWAGGDKPSVLAAVTSRGTIQLWDANTKQKTSSWRVPSGITALVWSGPVLTLAGNKGLMRQCDTRMDPRQLMKVRPKGGDRDKHWAPVRSLAFNQDGKKLLSGDDSGMVYIWDTRTWGKQNFGDTALHYQKRIQHPAAVRALAWCPWKHNMFASADAGEFTSTLRLYDIDHQSTPKEPQPLSRSRSARLSQPTPPAPDPNDAPVHSITYDAPVTSIHWSEHITEILTTHGPGRLVEPGPVFNDVLRPPIPPRHACSVAVWSVSRQKEVTVLSAGDTGISGSCMSPNGQKIVLVMPEEKKLKIWDVWKPPLKRSDSKLSIMNGNPIR